MSWDQAKYDAWYAGICRAVEKGCARSEQYRQQPERFAFRNACIVRWQLAGVPMTVIADRLDLSPVRVRQIVERHKHRKPPLDDGPLPPLSAREARRMLAACAALEGLLHARDREAAE